MFIMLPAIAFLHRNPFIIIGVIAYLQLPITMGRSLVIIVMFEVTHLLATTKMCQWLIQPQCVILHSI